MKKIIFILIVLLSSFGVMAQYPNKATPIGTDSSTTKIKGMAFPNGITIPAFADTTSANAKPYINYYNGSLIRVASDIWIRYNNGWYKQGGSGFDSTVVHRGQTETIWGNKYFLQNVGIGDIAPLSKLSVLSATNKTIQIGSTAGGYNNVTYFPDFIAAGNAINFSRPADGIFTEQLFNYQNTSGITNLGFAARGGIRFMSGATPSNILYFTDAGKVGIGTAIPVAPLHVGDLGNFIVSNDPGIMVARSITDANGPGSSHQFLSQPYITRNGVGTGFVDYDARTKFGGSTSVDHWVGLQNLPKWSSTGTLTNAQGVFNALVIDSGAVIANYNYYSADAGGVGSLQYNYGFYAANMAKGSISNYGFFQNGGQSNYFGGSVGVGDSIPTSKLFVRSGALKAIQIGSTTGNYDNNAYFSDYVSGNNNINLSRTADGVYSEQIFNYNTSGGLTNVGIGTRGGVRFMTGATPSNIFYFSDAGNLGIGNGTPAASALLDMTSTTRGLLIPRMTNTQMNAIASPATSLEVFNTTLGSFMFYNGSVWIGTGTNNNWSLKGNAGTSFAAGNFLGTTDNNGLWWRTNNINRGGIDSSGRFAFGNISPQYKVDVSGDINVSQDSFYRYGGTVALFKKGFSNWFFANAGNTSTSSSINLGISPNALTNVTTGEENIAIGYSSLYYNTIGSKNIGIGTQAASTTKGLGNVAIGWYALGGGSGSSNDISWNTAIGKQSLSSVRSGAYRNTGIGDSAMIDLTTGTDNTAIGTYTGTGITTGSSNTVIGANVSGLSSSLSNNVILSDGAGNKRFWVDNTGKIKLPPYGVGTFTGTAAYALQVDASGNIIEGSVGGGGFSNPMTTGGDLIYGGAAGAATRLANGTNNQILTSTGGTTPPIWSSNVTANTVTLSGNLTQAAWTTNGIRLKGVPATFTDNTSSGTVATAYTDVLGGNTIAATGATTFTNYNTVFIKEPVAGTNVTFTNKAALGVESFLAGIGGQFSINNTGNVTAPTITLSGNITAPAWTTNGLRFKGIPSTFTDNTSSGTVATAYTDVLGGNTIAATSATTFTNYNTFFFKEPVAGTNVTFTNKAALGTQSFIAGTSNQFSIGSTGNIIAGSLSTNGLVKTTGGTGALSISQGTGFIKDNGSGSLSYDNTIVGSSGLTTNYNIKYNGTSYVNSLIYDNGTGLQIGGTSPPAASLFDVVSTTKGTSVLPRMTNAQMAAITSPFAGLQVVNTDSAYRTFTYDGSAWRGSLFYSSTAQTSLTTGMVAAGFSISGSGLSYTMDIASVSANLVMRSGNSGGRPTMSAMSVADLPAGTVNTSQAANSTDADFTAVTNTDKNMPVATLTADRTITIPSGNNGDVISFFNDETNFAWLVSGVPVYYPGNSAVLTRMPIGPVTIKFKGVWRILYNF